MRRFFLNVLYIFYRYYDKGATQSISYESALLALLFLLFLNASAVSIFFDFYIDGIILSGKQHRVRNYIVVFSITIVLFVLLKRVFKKEDVEDFPEELRVKGGGVLLFLYSISSVLLLIYIINLTQ